MWSAAAAVTCATVGLSGAVAASAAPAKASPATQAVTSPAGDKDKDKEKIPYPRLDTTNIITSFTTTGATPTVPTNSRTYTGSARRGHVWINDTTGWRDITSVFPAGFYYDISLAAAPSTPRGAEAAPLVLGATGIPAGLLRVTVRRADGVIYRSDCTVTDVSGTNAAGTGTARSLANITCGPSATV